MENSFYVNGLKFSCQRCSGCCRHAPGYVFLSYNDLDKLCFATNTPRKLFAEKYCRVVEIGGFERVSLIEKPNYDCIFWEEGGCIVYEHRPLQCMSYPFWSSNLYSKESWDELAESCPGINCGKLNSYQTIERWLKKKVAEGFIRVQNGKIVL